MCVQVRNESLRSADSAGLAAPFAALVPRSIDCSAEFVNKYLPLISLLRRRWFMNQAAVVGRTKRDRSLLMLQYLVF